MPALTRFLHADTSDSTREGAPPLAVRGLTLLVNNTVGQGLSFLASLAIARVLGAGGFGAYAAVMALVFVLSVAVEAGLEATLTREVAREPGAAGPLLAASLRAKAAIGACLAAALAAPPVARALAPTPDAVGAVQLAGVLLTLNAANSSFAAVFRAWGRMRYVLAVNVTGLAVQLAGVVAVLLLAPGVTTLVAWLVAVQAGELLGGLALFRRGSRRLGAALPGATSAAALVRRSLPFALAGVLGALQLRVDLLLLAALRPAADVGVFSVAARLQGLLMLAPASFFAALFPALAAAHGEAGSPAGRRLYARSLARMAAAGAAAAVLGIALADVLVVAAFGSAYRGAALPLRLLALETAPLLLNTTTTLQLYATGRERIANLAAALNVALRLLLGWGLVRRWGAAGAAAADLAAEAAVLALYLVLGVVRESAGREVAEGVAT